MASVSPPKQAAPVEFPHTSEARINDRSLGVSLKGNKKHVGRVAPPNLNRLGHLHLQPNRLNRVELSYANAPMVRLYILHTAVYHGYCFMQSD